MKFSDTIRPFRSLDFSKYVRVYVAGHAVGWTKPDFAKTLDAFNDTWSLRTDGLHMSDTLDSYDTRTTAIDETFTAMAEAGFMPPHPDYSALGGIDWFPIYSTGRGERLAIIKRYYARFLGIEFDCVMIHGFHGDTYWSAKRGPLADEPDTMDIMVAGAVRHDQSFEEAMIDEGMDEANIPHDMLVGLQTVGKIRLCYAHPSGFVMNENFHLYELDTGSAFTPNTNRPAEVEGFYPISMHDMADMVQQGDVFKTQINMVMTEFLIRHGYLTDAHPDYAEAYALLYNDYGL